MTDTPADDQPPATYNVTRWMNHRQHRSPLAEAEAQSAGTARGPTPWARTSDTPDRAPTRANRVGGINDDKVARLQAMTPEQLVAHVDAVLAERRHPAAKAVT